MFTSTLPKTDVSTTLVQISLTILLTIYVFMMQYQTFFFVLYSSRKLVFSAACLALCLQPCVKNLHAEASLEVTPPSH